MKITRLVEYLQETAFLHDTGKNIPINVKHKIYESYAERMKTMSTNRFCLYLNPFWIKRTSVKEIIKIWEKNYPCSLSYSFWEAYERDNYQTRYKETSRTKKVDRLSQEQIEYLTTLRENEPNKGYKLFENWLFIPENKEAFTQAFWADFILSKRLFYDFIEKYKIDHRITKRHKIGLLAEHKKNNTLETYIATMHHIYAGYRALHRWQVDIKYLTDIPNYVRLWIFDIFLYEITFRDYKSWATICFYGDDRSKSSVFLGFDVFKELMINMGVCLKDIIFQFDGWAEFSNIRISGIKWDLIEMIERDFGWYRLIERKEQNGHVESFHRRVEEDLFDTGYISRLKEKVDKKEIEKKELKWEILKLLNTYILNFNNYWYSSYKPRYELFWKKSPITIIKEDWNKEIEAGTLQVNFLEKYLWAYDVSQAYSLIRIHDYSSILNASIMMREDKFDFAANSIKLVSDNYLFQFYEFLDPTSSGRIWNGTIEQLQTPLLTYEIISI